MDAPRAGVLRRHERLHPTRRPRSSLGRGGRGTFPGGRAHGRCPGPVPGNIPAYHRSAQYLVPERVRCPVGLVHLLCSWAPPGSPSAMLPRLVLPPRSLSLVLSGPLLGERVGWSSGTRHCAGLCRNCWRWWGRRLALPRRCAAIAIAGAVLYALALIWLRKIGPGETPEAVVLHFSVVGLCAMLAFAIPVWEWPDCAKRPATAWRRTERRRSPDRHDPGLFTAPGSPDWRSLRPGHRSHPPARDTGLRRAS